MSVPIQGCKRGSSHDHWQAWPKLDSSSVRSLSDVAPLQSMSPPSSTPNADNRSVRSFKLTVQSPFKSPGSGTSTAVPCGVPAASRPSSQYSRSEDATYSIVDPQPPS